MSNNGKEGEAMPPSPPHPKQQEEQEQHKMMGMDEEHHEEEKEEGREGSVDTAVGGKASPPALQAHEMSREEHESVGSEQDNNTQGKSTSQPHSAPPSLKESLVTREEVYAEAESQSTATDRLPHMSSTLPPSTSLPLREKQLGSSSRSRGNPSRRSSSSKSQLHSRGREYYSGETLKPLYTANNMTPKEEYVAFRARNGVSSNFTGPIFVVEDIHVMCAGCGAPVDPVTRVPAGKLFFHPQCIRCGLCGRVNVADAYFKAMSSTAVCSECAAKGFAGCVPREAAAVRGIIPGAVVGKLDDAIREYDFKQKIQTINKSTVQGVIPPTLVLAPLRDRRSYTQRQLSLMQRQQYYTQNDNNVIALPPEDLSSLSRVSSVTQHRVRKGETQKLM